MVWLESWCDLKVVCSLVRSDGFKILLEVGCSVVVLLLSFFLFFLLADETAVELHVGDLLQQSVKKMMNSKKRKIND